MHCLSSFKIRLLVIKYDDKRTGEIYFQCPDVRRRTSEVNVRMLRGYTQHDRLKIIPNRDLL